MIDTQARPVRYIKLLALVTFLGVISASITFSFMALVHLGTGLIWEQAAQALGLDLRIFTILVCTLGGLLVGLLIKCFGDHSGIFAEVMLQFGKTGRFEYRNAPGIVITAFISLDGGCTGRRFACASICSVVHDYAGAERDRSRDYRTGNLTQRSLTGKDNGPCVAHFFRS